MVFGLLYTIQFVGDNYKTFRTALKSISVEGTKLDSPQAKLVIPLTLQHFANSIGKSVNELASQFEKQEILIDFKGWIRKVGRENSGNITVRTYQVFFQYPLSNLRLTDPDEFETNLNFSLMVDVLVRSVMQSISVAVADVKEFITDYTCSTSMKTFEILFTEKDAKEEGEISSGKQSSVPSYEPLNNNSERVLQKSFSEVVKALNNVVDKNNELVDKNNRLVEVVLQLCGYKINSQKE